jgi:hypothetical protein
LGQFIKRVERQQAVQQMAVPAAAAAAAPSTFTFPTCENGPSKHVAFLKTHKTGSSTMSNIMLRFADTHNLTVGLPLEGKWELGGYPAYIDQHLIGKVTEHRTMSKCQTKKALKKSY